MMRGYDVLICMYLLYNYINKQIDDQMKTIKGEAKKVFDWPPKRIPWTYDSFMYLFVGPNIQQSNPPF